MSEYANYDDYHDPEEEDSYDAIYGKKNSKSKIIKNLKKKGRENTLIFNELCIKKTQENRQKG